MKKEILPSGIPGNAEVAYKGKIFRVYTWEQQLFDGTYSIFERVVVRGSVIVIPITERNTIIVARQTQPSRNTFIGFIGGKMEKNELPLEAAKRELMEETGISGDSWLNLGTWSPFYKVHWPQHYFVVRQLTISSKTHTDKNEKIELLELTIDDFHSLMLNNNFTDYIFKSVYLSLAIKHGKPNNFEDFFNANSEIK